MEILGSVLFLINKSPEELLHWYRLLAILKLHRYARNRRWQFAVISKTGLSCHLFYDRQGNHLTLQLMLFLFVLTFPSSVMKPGIRVLPHHSLLLAFQKPFIPYIHRNHRYCFFLFVDRSMVPRSHWTYGTYLHELLPAFFRLVLRVEQGN